MSKPFPLQWIELDSSAYRHNLHTFRSMIDGSCRLAAVVKANAYGHGLVPIARLAEENGADLLAVNALEEGVALREAGIRSPVMVMGYIQLNELDIAVERDLEPVLYNGESLVRLDQEARRQGKRIPYHLKVETGLHRQGVTPTELDGVLRVVKGSSAAWLKGVSMHFANIEDTTDHSYAAGQLERFNGIIGLIRRKTGADVLAHTACSAAAILFPRTHFQLVRIGISSYGLWPSKETYLSAVLNNQQPPVLKPLLTWKTRVAQIKDVPADSFVGYGCSFRTTQAIRLAVLPVGYFDGYDRRLSSRASVLIRGKRAPVLGRVCMNMIMVDVTHIPDIGLEDEVVLLGTQGAESVSAEELAGICQTINYDLVTRLGAHIPRFVIR